MTGLSAPLEWRVRGYGARTLHARLRDVSDHVRDRDRAELLIEAGLALASERSLEAVLQRIVELAVDITVARYGAISVLAPDGRHRGVHHRGDHAIEERAVIGDPPTGHGILGLLITRGASAPARGYRGASAVGGVPAPSSADALAPRGARPRPWQGLRQHLRDREAGATTSSRSTTSARSQVLADPGGRGRRERSAVRRDGPRAGRGPTARGPGRARADREGAARRSDPVALRRGHEPAGRRRARAG